MAGTDFSILRLRPTLQDALRLSDPLVSTINYHSFVHVKPTDRVLQMTNLKDDIDLSGGFTAKLLQINGQEIADITSIVGVAGFTDQYGVKQIAFEIAPIGVDYFAEYLVLQLSNTEEQSWYSSPFICSELQSEQTTLLQYSCDAYFKGFDYAALLGSDNMPFMQTIRVAAYYHQPADEVEDAQYNQISTGFAISPRLRIYQKNAYKCEYLTPHLYRALQVALAHDVIYLDGIRVTDRPKIKMNDRLGNTNLLPCEFIASMNVNEVYDDGFQIIEETPTLSVIDRTPIHLQNYNSAGFFDALVDGGHAAVYFDENIDFIEPGATFTLYENGVEILSGGVDSGDFVILLDAPNALGFMIFGYVTTPGATYSIVFGDVVQGVSGGRFDGYEFGEWQWTFNTADWLAEDWDNNDFMTF